MLTFIEKVKGSVKRRAGFERHKMMPIKKLISPTNHKKMYLFLQDISRRNNKARIDHIPDLGVVLYFPVKHSNGWAYDLKNKAKKLNVSQILHVDNRENERTVYACLEDLL